MVVVFILKIILIKKICKIKIQRQSDNDPWKNPYETDKNKTQWTPYDLSEASIIEAAFI